MVRAEWIREHNQDLANRRAIAMLGGICLIQLYLGMPAIAEQSDESLPSTAFLEFLADWENENGAWQDPMEYQEMGLEFLDQRENQDDE
ncbi:MAG: hypothetical protein B6D72_09645 [gamma proteobacterium symbiont of Ctena orbiculata]|uniref:Uncharacterized protein n=1 Tax=Candidatus Thiodiazotropha taylori TaxID=2792791 RepID=A0A944M764_9GAMM|nr:hypothetical protein [Candidatus Thiodiazotropha taylori]PUB83821.1 MAG: hypothetical protein DBP00_15610 [gamma proteobacterium symbiont of Ctena orbiculata]MBT2988423.1 hypothetical protein [Candidatus Thiodiazotropha taylori]MBT2997330.1 hypothetical protein [Candidatus Thiodiazotropha taylori]MBT3000960.1 hypothetical protein [Candidatus Thiodiazotropha taylori]